MARTISCLIVCLLVSTAFADLGADGIPADPTSTPAPTPATPAPTEPAKDEPKETKPADEKQTQKSQEAPEPPVAASKLNDFPSLLDAVEWMTPPVDLDRLYGQTVVVVFVETWCPTCNGSAPDYCRLLQVAAERKPVTIIYLGVGLSKPGFQQYMRSKGLNGHAAGVVSPTVAREFGFGETLWRAVVINPLGQRVFSGQFFTYYPKADKKVPVISTDLADYCGDAEPIVEPPVSSKLGKVDQAIRVGQLGAALKALARMGDEGKKTHERLLAHGEKLYNVAWSYEKAEPYLAYRLAVVVAEEYKGEAVADKAAALAKRLEQDKLVQLGKSGDKKLSQLNAKAVRQPNPNQIDAGFKFLTEQYRDCRAGRVAMTALTTPLESDNKDGE
ncbi:MAG: redoxin family protein [Planctomycetes bacterium]|nr:redoxin family protein [Planctomycetota bacterium]